MSNCQKETITIIYYSDASLELEHLVCQLEKAESGRVVIPDELKQGKSIIAVCHGEVNILNKAGERIIPHVLVTSTQPQLIK
ncbi:TIGR02922 family protein [Thalassotalea sp. G2M2-11]|uniref:TIGR02922 family protein n=1 Tax=Thalassotalea sp. G2M2-11 TaxID=2787627 RepID=UPI0019D1D36C|nr:TIGR02922 family protein [Thalassotalea sp. G2M2-11]